MLKLHFITSGILTINLENLTLGRHQKDVLANCKTYLTEASSIYLEAKDMGYFTDWGIIELVPANNDSPKFIRAMIDSQVWGWYATAQILLIRDGQVITSENFQSGIRGPIGDPRRYRSYPVLEV